MRQSRMLTITCLLMSGCGQGHESAWTEMEIWCVNSLHAEVIYTFQFSNGETYQVLNVDLHLHIHSETSYHSYHNQSIAQSHQ